MDAEELKAAQDSIVARMLRAGWLKGVGQSDAGTVLGWTAEGHVAARQIRGLLDALGNDVNAHELAILASYIDKASRSQSGKETFEKD
jgi:hypothetical protein